MFAGLNSGGALCPPTLERGIKMKRIKLITKRINGHWQTEAAEIDQNLEDTLQLNGADPLQASILRRICKTYNILLVPDGHGGGLQFDNRNKSVH